MIAPQIWVGKEAGAGAQISVPSVRGDRVLWMCGGHQKSAVAMQVGGSNHEGPKEAGKMAPCDGKVRARHALGQVGGGAARVSQKELQRFGDLSKLVAAIDRCAARAARPSAPSPVRPSQPPRARGRGAAASFVARREQGGGRVRGASAFAAERAVGPSDLLFSFSTARGVDVINAAGGDECDDRDDRDDDGDTAATTTTRRRRRGSSSTS